MPSHRMVSKDELRAVCDLRKFGFTVDPNSVLFFTDSTHTTAFSDAVTCCDTTEGEVVLVLVNADGTQPKELTPGRAEVRVVRLPTNVQFAIGRVYLVRAPIINQ